MRKSAGTDRRSSRFHTVTVLALSFLCGSPLLAAASAPSCGGRMDRAQLNRCLEQSLERHRNVAVVYQDVLGEGPGHWDPDPLYPSGSVNCIIWLDLLLADTYGSTPAEKEQVMNRLRYFKGQIAFGTRKHFTDNWMAFDPEPLVRTDLSACPGVQNQEIQLDPDRFRASVGYKCPLYKMRDTSFEIPFVSGDGLVQCAAGFRPGYYVVFPLASDRYLQKYGANSGPMGQVHAVLLKVPAEGAGVNGSDLTVYHASISSGRVVETRLPAYIRTMANLFRGYALYELDPAWDWKRKPSADKEAREILSCEAKMKGKVGAIFKPAAPNPGP
jgi:hypothetical protein